MGSGKGPVERTRMPQKKSAAPAHVFGAFPFELEQSFPFEQEEVFPDEVEAAPAAPPLCAECGATADSSSVQPCRLNCGSCGFWRIHGRAYALQDWLPHHPGGQYLLQITRGTDCTELYESYHAPSLQAKYISSTLAKYAVVDDADSGKGESCTVNCASLSPPPPPPPQPSSNKLNQYVVEPTTYEWKDSPVYDDMKKVVHAYRRLHGVKATDSWAAMFTIGFFAVVHCVALARWLTGSGGILNAFVLGLSIWYSSGSMMHDGTHYALTHSSRLSELMGWFGGFMFCLPATWIRQVCPQLLFAFLNCCLPSTVCPETNTTGQHVTGHHVHTNVPECDPDLYHFSHYFNVALPEFLFKSPKQKRQNKELRWIVPFMAQVSNLKMSHELWREGKMKGCTQKTIWAPAERLVLICTLLAFAAVMARMVFVQWWSGLVVIPFGVVGVLFYGFSQVSHINSDSFVKPQSKEWAVHQIATTRGDYGYHSRVWNILSLGLNNQALHHCFPSVHPCHYPALSKLMHPVFVKHGLPVNGWNQTYWDSLCNHIAHLRAFN